jgi:hypothetical protein
MTEGEKAGRYAMAYLLMALVATWWTIACIAWYHFKEWFL